MRILTNGDSSWTESQTQKSYVLASPSHDRRYLLQLNITSSASCYDTDSFSFTFIPLCSLLWTILTHSSSLLFCSFSFARHVYVSASYELFLLHAYRRAGPLYTKAGMHRFVYTHTLNKCRARSDLSCVCACACVYAIGRSNISNRILKCYLYQYKNGM